MDKSEVGPTGPERPGHRRQQSSKSNILRALVSPKTESFRPPLKKNERTKSVPLLPPDHIRSAAQQALGERHSNVQSPPSSPSKSRYTRPNASREGRDPIEPSQMPTSPQKSKSHSNFSAVFAKVNRSSKDLSACVQKDKENATPPVSSNGSSETPIWAQFASTAEIRHPSCPNTSDRESSSIEEEITRYTPKDHGQRNFNGTFEQPSLRPRLPSRPQSAFIPRDGIVAAIGRRVSGGRPSIEVRRSEDGGRRESGERGRRSSGDKGVLKRWNTTDRQVSNSSAEQAPSKEKLAVTKRGSRVMAAVAAFQGFGKIEQVKAEPVLDPEAVDQDFEAVLDSRNIPEPMRQKMRCLTLRVKADFIKQERGSKTADMSPKATISNTASGQKLSQELDANFPAEQKTNEEDSKATKRSRARSRTFTFSKADKRGDTSPAKKQRSRSKTRPLSVNLSKDTSNTSSMTTAAAPFDSLNRKNVAPATPIDYLAYLQKHQDPTKLEVGRLHKLRILLRNETVAWVNDFVSLGGMAEIVGLLHRIMQVEWREEHEDQLLHETLLCLKGLCTTERAMAELEKVADELFPALLGMLFDDEKKGPAEYTTRSIIINVLFNFLSSATSSSAEALEHRARKVLCYLGEPSKPEDARPVDFVLHMHIPRPYKLWLREVSHVTKEVFWIFLHHLNVVPLPKDASDFSAAESGVADISDDRAKILATTYTQRHFPGARAPVPAAPYIGGVEWDATSYLAAHLDLLNGLIASIPSAAARNALREELQASGFEKAMGGTLRTCKEKFYSSVHDGLRAWVAAGVEDGWDTRLVREGPTAEEHAYRARSASPKKSPKKNEEAPKLVAPKLDLALDDLNVSHDINVNDDGWLG